MLDKKEKIVEYISKMSIVEISELISMIEKKFSIKYENINNINNDNIINNKNENLKNDFNILLKDIGKNKISVIKSIRSIINIGLKEAKELVESYPVIIKEKVNKEDSEKIKKILEESGAIIDLV